VSAMPYEYVKSFRARMRAAGMCECGARPIARGDACLCAPCRKSRRASNRRSYWNKKRVGVCRCGDPVTVGFKSCAECRMVAVVKDKERKAA
jgi:hypothetical protein